MVARQLGHLAGRAARAARPVTDRAAQSRFVQTLKAEYEKGKAGDPPDAVAAAADPEVTAEAQEVADAMRRVDWAKVKAATASTSGAARRQMRKMAADVDWRKVQAGAATVSSALIAGVASGQIPVGGTLAGPIARAITDEHGLGELVSVLLQRSSNPPPDFRSVIETTARES